MDDRSLLINIIVLAAALVALLLFPQPIWMDPTMTEAVPDALQQGKAGDTQNDPYDVNPRIHRHAYLYFLVDGERKQLSPAYIERNPFAHFHHDDGIIHIEGKPATLKNVFTTLNITIEEDCITYHLDDEEYCADDGHDIRININGDNVPIGEALRYEIQQDDNIVIYHGDRDATIHEDYTEETLPDAYRPPYRQL